MTERKARTGKQAQASRANGAKSRGPSSKSGKAKSAKNSKKHGLTSSKADASEAEQAEVEELLLKLQGRYNADDPEQATLISRAVNSSLRLKRTRALITQSLEDIADPENPRRAGAKKLVYQAVIETRIHIQKIYGGDPPSYALAKAVAEKSGLISHMPRPSHTALNKLMRYAQRFRGERDRALSRLEAMRRYRLRP